MCSAKAWLRSLKGRSARRAKKGSRISTLLRPCTALPCSCANYIHTRPSRSCNTERLKTGCATSRAHKSATRHPCDSACRTTGSHGPTQSHLPSPRGSRGCVGISGTLPSAHASPKRAWRRLSTCTWKACGLLATLMR